MRPRVVTRTSVAWRAPALAVVFVGLLAGAAWVVQQRSWPADFDAPAQMPVPEKSQVLREVPSASERRPVTARAAVATLPAPADRPSNGLALTFAGIVAALSVAAGLALLSVSFLGRNRRSPSWLRDEAGAVPVVSEAERRRFDVLRRAIFHPIDFVVARGWSMRASGGKSLSASAAIKGYRELTPEPPIRSGVRLDLDHLEIGFVDLVSAVGEPHDGRILVARGYRVLLNRNHPTVGDLLEVAGVDARRARVLLDVLLATDPELARGTDPRQVEWDLLSRAERGLQMERAR